MTKDEYTTQLGALYKEFNVAKTKLMVKYALSSAKYQVGDIIKDERWTLLVDEVRVYPNSDNPLPIYEGVRLKTDLTPRANGERVSIFGEHGVQLVLKAGTFL